jgi:hypothetical protein
MIKKKILSPSKRFKNAESEDLTLRINLEEDKNLLREGDKTIILDIAEQFKKERNESTKYRIYGKMNMVFRNTYSGTTTYEPLLNNLYVIGDGIDGDFTGYVPYNEFAFIRNDYVRQVSSPSGTTMGDFSPNLVITGDTSHRTINEMDVASTNWNVFLSYVHDKDSTHQMRYTLSGNTQYSFTASNGIPFRVEEFTTHYELTSPIPHNMSEGEFVILSGTSISSGSESDRVFPIASTGNEVFNSEKYVINVQKSTFTSSQTLSGVVFGKRCLDKTKISETTSEYYVHKHKILTNSDGCIVDRTGFETPVFEIERKLQYETADARNNIYSVQNRPETILYHFKDEVDIQGLTNNLGYTVTDLYVTTLFKNGNGYFNYPPRLGWRFNFHNSWVDNQFDTGFGGSDSGLPSTTFQNSGVTFTQGTELTVGDELVGAFVEYNKEDFKETILSEALHKFTMDYNIFNHSQVSNNDGSSTTNPKGLFYQPHYRVKLRQLSPYIETANTNKIDGLPENSLYDTYNKQWKWRDLYDHGYTDPDGFGVNHPFTNGQHYVKSDINFYLRNEETFLNKTDGISNFTVDNDSLC